MKSRSMMSNDTGIVARYWQATDLLQLFPESLLQLMFRIGIGAVFFKSGLTKIANWDLTVMLFKEEYQVPLLPPDIAAHLAAACELTAPVFLVLGLLGRLATLPMLGMVLVIQTFVYPDNWAEHLTWTSMLLYILTRGPGPFSLDYAIERGVLNGRRWKHEAA